MMNNQDPSALTEEQEKAWKSLKRALKKCRDANIYWYQVLDSLQPLNGEIVETVVVGRGEIDGRQSIRADEVAGDAVTISCSFADDAHYIVLKDE